MLCPARTVDMPCSKDSLIRVEEHQELPQLKPANNNGKKKKEKLSHVSYMNTASRIKKYMLHHNLCKYYDEYRR